MASRERAGSDSDDSDEYETMSPMAVAELMQESLQSQLQQLTTSNADASTKTKKDKEKNKSGTKTKKKGIFRRMSRGKSPKPKAKKAENFKETVILKPHSSSPKAKSAAHLAGRENELPTLGPKPPRVLTPEEKIKQIKREQKEKVAAARQERLRRSSEPCQSLDRSANLQVDYTIDRSFGELDANDIVSQYSNQLPLDLVVSKGVYGMEEKYSLSTSDRCIIHFIKRRESVQIQDPKDNEEFLVPINSAIKFSIIYNPHNDEHKAMLGYNFSTVADIMSESPMPKMGLAHLKDPDILGMKSMEILVVKEVLFPNDPMDPRKLRFYSLTSNCQRDLVETMEINFNTRPSFMQVYLTDILKHVPNPCPLHLGMYRNPIQRPLIAPGIPATMFRRPLYLKKRFTDILLVATGNINSETGEQDHAYPFEIPTDIDVEFEVIKHSQEEKEKIIANSKKLKEKLTDRDIKHYRYVGMSDEQHRMQLSLYKSLRDGCTLEGGVAEVEKNDEAVDGDYVKATSGNRLAMTHRVELLEENMKRCSHSLAEAKSTIALLTTDNATLTDLVRALEEKNINQSQQSSQIESLSQQVDSVITDIEQMRAELDALKQKEEKKERAELDALKQKEEKKEIPDDTRTSHMIFSSQSLDNLQDNHHEHGNLKEVHERNRELLSHMNITEVQQMLKLAGLSQYMKTIITENISGDILIECNEMILEEELGIKSKLHRLKLLKLIGGKGPIEMYKLVD